MSGARILALVRKDMAELAQHPGTLVTPLLMTLTFILPAFFIAVITPAWSGESLDTGELGAAARAAAARVPALAALTGVAQAQALLFLQFLVLVVNVPVAGSMALAAQAVIGEKQARTLEPLLATPLKTSELLAAKTLTPLLVSCALHLLGVALYATGIVLFAQPGVWRVLTTATTLLLLFGAAPLLSLLSLQLAVIISSRVNDPRSAQQLGVLVVLPITALFLAQLLGGFLVGAGFLLGAMVVLVVLNAALLAVGVRVFDRERILLSWK